MRPLAGHTLLEYAARAARESGVLDRVILSTDSLEIADAGRGFDPAQVNGEGYGLANIRERAAALGGEARIAAAPGQGTSVRISLPL